MAISLNTTYKQNNSPAFKRLVQVKFSRNFNPSQSNKDYLAYKEFLNSKAFQYLFENTDVKAVFDKFTHKDSKSVSTVLHLAVKPKKQKTELNQSLLKRILKSLKSHFLEDEWKKNWIEGIENTQSSKDKSNLLFKKLEKVTIEDIKSRFSI